MHTPLGEQATERRVPMWLRSVVGAAAVLIVGYLAVRKVDWVVVGASLRGARVGYVFAAAVVTLVSTMLKGLRWWIFLRETTNLRLGHVLRLTVVGIGLNSVAFANAGDIARVGLAARASGGLRAVVAALARDKLVEVLAFACVVAVAVPLQPAGLLPRSTGIIASASIVVLVIVAFATRLGAARAAAAFGISIVSWITQVITYGLGILAVGAQLPVGGWIATLIAVNTAGVLRTTPGNVGIFQFAFVLAATRYGMSRDAAVASAVLIQSIQLSSALLAAGVAALVGRRGSA